MSESVRPLMLYDGLCGMCNGVVKWVIRHDKRDRFRFAAQQSALAAEILGRHGIDREDLLAGNSVYLVIAPQSAAGLAAGSTQERLLRESEVPVFLLMTLGGGWAVLGRLLRAIPASLRNAAYRLFARNRYRLGSRYTVCPIPAEADRLKFVA